jgi:acetolactate synthase small subunit
VEQVEAVGQAVEAAGRAVVDEVVPVVPVVDVVDPAVAAEEAAVVVVNAALKGRSRLSRFVDALASSRVDAVSAFLPWSLLVTRTDGWAGVTGRRLKFPWL